MDNNKASGELVKLLQAAGRFAALAVANFNHR
jgi:hypothetical protein